MKKIFYILLFVFAAGGPSFAQDDADDGGGKLRDKMIEYIKDKLSLSKEEAEKFQPIFLDYLRQLRTTRDQFKGDKILLQQKIAELRLRTRDQFKPVLGEKRSNEVFDHQDGFIKKARQELIERQGDRKQGPANKKTRMLQ
jgi:hypothetical protein